MGPCLRCYWRICRKQAVLRYKLRPCSRLWGLAHVGAGFELLSRTLFATSCPCFLVQLWLVLSMSFYLAPPLPTHYLIHFTRSGVLTMTAVLILPTTFRLEVCSLASPILLTFTTWDSGCIYLLVFCSWRPLVAYLLMC